MKIIASIMLVLFCSESIAQQRSYFDPAQAYNRLLIEKNNGTFTRVGNFKVVGTSFLYGEKNKGDIYAPNEAGKDISLSYDTYTQNVDFFPSSSPGVALTKEPSSLDSFKIKMNQASGIEKDITFIYGNLLGVKDKVYFQAVARGKKVNLYKKYTSELGMVTTNYIQSELRQFNILVDYYYADSTGRGLKKLKISPKNLIKEFVAVKDLSAIINEDDLTANRENELIRLFGEMNKE